MIHFLHFHLLNFNLFRIFKFINWIIYFSIGSDYSSISNRGTGSTGGTPSRLSVGRGAGSGWNTPTPANTWNTEGTPSYTASSLSGAASLGESGPSAGVGQSSLDDVCDVCVGPMFVFLISFTFLKPNNISNSLKCI